MARPLRVEFPGAFPHVINRGNAGKVVFESHSDREKYLILGGPDFVNWAKDKFLSSGQASKENPQLKALQPGVDPSDIVSASGDMFGVDAEQILSRDKKKDFVRGVAIQLSGSLTRLSGNELGRRFGDFSGAAITMRYKAMTDQIINN